MLENGRELPRLPGSRRRILDLPSCCAHVRRLEYWDVKDVLQMVLLVHSQQAGSGCTVFSILGCSITDTKVKMNSSRQQRDQIRLHVTHENTSVPPATKALVPGRQRKPCTSHSSQPRNLAWQYGHTSNSSKSDATKLGPSDSCAWSKSSASAFRNCRSQREQYLDIPGS